MYVVSIIKVHMKLFLDIHKTFAEATYQVLSSPGLANDSNRMK